LGTTTKIEWADATANFWIGCSKVAYGCAHCYAETFAKRVGADVWGKDKPRRFVKGVYGDLRLLNRDAIETGTRPRVFVSSLCDFFDDGDLEVVDVLGRPLFEDIAGTFRHDAEGSERLTVGRVRDAAWEVLNDCEAIDFMILTKRPEAVRANWKSTLAGENIWLGVSAATDGEYVEAFKQLDALRHLARFTFVSAEPMVEDIRPRLGGFAGTLPPDLVIVGGESGGSARPCRVEWVRNFVRSRRQHPEGARIFIKQLGSRVPDSIVKLEDAKGGRIEEWPPDIRVRELPRGAYGAA